MNVLVSVADDLLLRSGMMKREPRGHGRSGELGADFLEKVMSANNDGGDFLLDYTLPQHKGGEEPISWDTKCMLLGMSALISVQARIYNAQREQDTTKLFAIGRQGFPLLLINGAKDSYLSG